VEGEIVDEILILRSSVIKYLYESLNKIKDHVDDILQIEFHLQLDNKIMIRNLNGKKEIQLFLEERIFPRNGKYKFFVKKEKKNLISNIGSIINNLYAKKTSPNNITN